MAGLLRNRLYFCRCVIPITPKCYSFEVRVCEEIFLRPALRNQRFYKRSNFTAWRSFSRREIALGVKYFTPLFSRRDLISRSSHFHAKSEINSNRGEHGEKF